MDGFTSPWNLKLSQFKDLWYLLFILHWETFINTSFCKIALICYCCCFLFFFSFFLITKLFQKYDTECLTSSRFADYDIKLTYNKVINHLWHMTRDAWTQDELYFSAKDGLRSTHTNTPIYDIPSVKRGPSLYILYTTSWGDCLFLLKNFGWRQNQQDQIWGTLHGPHVSTPWD